MIQDHCDECGADLEAADEAGIGDVWIAHVRSAHPDWPFSDAAIRNFAVAPLRLTGGTERLDTIGAIEVHPVTPDRIDDWVAFFDHDGFADNRAWAACYCYEPHRRPKGAPPDAAEDLPWRENRAAMIARLHGGDAFGYLAYVDGKVAGWVNASKRSDYALYRAGEGAAPADTDTAGVSCFVVAPPYRRHGVAGALLDRVVADAGGRGLGWVEAYPDTEPDTAGAPPFRGRRAMYDERGFEPVGEEGSHVIVRRRA